MKTFSIFGDIVSQDEYKNSFEDLTPTQFEAFIRNLDEKEPFTIDFSSCGGDVYAGITIANIIKREIANGREITANVIGICASIASVIACACSKIQIADNAFLMVHLPWCQTSGNALELQKDIDQLNHCKQAIISFYKSKFDLSDEEIEKMMINETWILGKDAKEYKLNCEIIPSDNELKIAAKLKNKGYKNMPKKLKTDEREDNKIVDSVVTVDIKGNEEKEEPEKELIPKDEVDKRVSGMQSKMQEQINNLRKEFSDKLTSFETDFKNQLTEKENQLSVANKELAEIKDKAINLTAQLDKTQKELQETVSALRDKTSALDMLNSSVNTPPEEKPTFDNGLAKCKTLKERVEFIKSGNYKTNN